MPSEDTAPRIPRSSPGPCVRPGRRLAPHPGAQRLRAKATAPQPSTPALLSSAAEPRAIWGRAAAQGLLDLPPSAPRPRVHE